MYKCFNEQVNHLLSQMKKLTKEGLDISEVAYYSKLYRDLEEVILGFEESIKYETLYYAENQSMVPTSVFDVQAIRMNALHVMNIDRRDNSDLEVLHECKKLMRNFASVMIEDINGYEITLRREAMPILTKGVHAKLTPEIGEAVSNLKNILVFKDQLSVSPFYIEPECEKKNGLEPGVEE